MLLCNKIRVIREVGFNFRGLCKKGELFYDTV